MAKPTLLLALAATFLSLAAFSATALNHHRAPAPAPHISETHAVEPQLKDAKPPEPYPGFYALVDKCLRKLSGNCGLDIFTAIFGDDKAVSDDCCVNLVAMGRRCHRKIMKATMLLPEFERREKTEIKNKDAEIWSHCVLVSQKSKFEYLWPHKPTTN
ncbi:hypothetical protein PHJA_000808400 [Phtheirospermum japonicum]|uniref:Prolamin-like domain-containing protein n=1 Tax=Phtheirospermum japonicum TaxID=374723 RepID=A0A830BIE0_9LAMI|nr:hypothetical protein PHJA_000808400 [Phtheirospermum japonicum]